MIYVLKQYVIFLNNFNLLCNILLFEYIIIINTNIVGKMYQLPYEIIKKIILNINSCSTKLTLLQIDKK